MSRLTITLPDERHAALKAEAAITGKTIGQIIDESLELAGVKSEDEALAILRKARRNAGLSEDEAMALALREVAEYRSGR